LRGSFKPLNHTEALSALTSIRSYSTAVPPPSQAMVVSTAEAPPDAPISDPFAVDEEDLLPPEAPPPEETPAAPVKGDANDKDKDALRGRASNWGSHRPARPLEGGCAA
jgi:hypothetical protein